MKKILLLSLLVMFTITLTAQAPKGMVKIEYKEAAQVAAEKTNEQYAGEIAYLQTNRFTAAFAEADKAFKSVYSTNPDVNKALYSLNERGLLHNKQLLKLLEIKGLVSIEVLDSLPENSLGGYIRFGNTFKVVLSKIIMEDPNVIEWTLAHELGEGGFGLEHTDPPLADGTYPWSAEIMTAAGILDKRHLLYQIRIHPYYGKDIWKNFFDQL